MENHRIKSVPSARIAIGVPVCMFGVIESLHFYSTAAGALVGDPLAVLVLTRLEDVAIGEALAIFWGPLCFCCLRHVIIIRTLVFDARRQTARVNPLDAG